MFHVRNQVRLYDTDAAGILYFASLFRYMQDAFEDFLAHENLNISKMFCETPFTCAVVHVEADYLKPLFLGEIIDIQLEIDHVGFSSFATQFHISNSQDLVAKGKMVHVLLDRETRTKIQIPESFHNILVKS